MWGNWRFCKNKNYSTKTKITTTRTTVVIYSIFAFSEEEKNNYSPDDKAIERMITKIITTIHKSKSCFDIYGWSSSSTLTLVESLPHHGFGVMMFL